jgi:hypothetical protein
MSHRASVGYLTQNRARSVGEAIALAIHTVVHIGIDRLKGERHIAEVLRGGYNAQEDTFITTPMYTFARDRVAP